MSHHVVVDLGFGDSGKGTVVDRLCAQGSARTVVRFNGGAQAAHNVVTVDGRHHTFAQFGSGTFTPDVRTHLSRFMLVDPLSLAAEAAHLRSVGVPDALDRLTVDASALLTTPYHRAVNRARESARGDGRHGSCGMGIGETAFYALEHPEAPRAGDCRSPVRLRRLLREVRDWTLSLFPEVDVPQVDDCAEAFLAFGTAVQVVHEDFLRRLLRDGPAVFEGAQGVLLDEWHGFHPYTTWSTTTFANAVELLEGADALRLGVVRKYLTRHGPGPFVTEDAALELPEPHNGHGDWQGAFRVGHFDAVAMRYALEVVGGVDGLAVTHLDAPPVRICGSYDGLERIPVRARDLAAQEGLTRRLMRARPVYDGWATGPADIGRALGVPVLLESYGPTSADKKGPLTSA